MSISTVQHHQTMHTRYFLMEINCVFILLPQESAAPNDRGRVAEVVSGRGFHSARVARGAAEGVLPGHYYCSREFQ